jgi:hypothetical protein
MYHHETHQYNEMIMIICHTVDCSQSRCQSRPSRLAAFLTANEVVGITTGSRRRCTGNGGASLPSSDSVRSISAIYYHQTKRQSMITPTISSGNTKHIRI